MENNASIEAYVHMDGTVSLDDICCGLQAKNFQTIARPGAVSKNFTDEIWLKIIGVKNSQVLDFGILDHKVELIYRELGKSDFEELQHGKSLRPEERWVQSNRIYFQLNNLDENFPIYARIQSVPNIPIYPDLFAYEDFKSDLDQEWNIHILCLGAAIIMMAFNLSLSLLTREPLFLLNFLAVFFAVVSNLVYTGILPAYVFGAWAQYYLEIVNTASVLGTIFSLLFLFVYLGGMRSDYRLVRFSLYLIVPSVLMFPLLVVVHQATFVPIYSLVNWLVTLAAFAILTVLSLKGHTPARILLPTLACVIIPTNVMTISSLYFSTEFWIPKEHILEYMIMSEALLFSLIVAYKMRQSRQAAVSAYNELERTQLQTNRKILQSVDAERKRIASDLHDTAGQGLMTISNRLKQFLETPGGAKSINSELTDVSEASTEVLDDIRRISHDLHPATLDFLGLEKSVRGLFKSLAKSRNFETEIEWGAAINILEQDRHIQIYRIIQEVVSNIAKHSDGDFVRAVFAAKGQYLEIKVSDNGTTMDLNRDAEIHPSLGKAIINQRINSMGGTWSFNRIDAHSVFRASIPCNVIESS